ncbi:hypothetical protein ACFFIF_01255 [Vagococcus entomophilus]|uniref:Uncharacterized protein n=1 Tax=Vagococcus entomophilus TaxID=1160095 RepID=A0A430AKQ4_9ENTE|nr:hypothetical protein [Vagococcus entomophilus]RSU08554.1 hypothetical protein CBF30_04805 [Vagococcus entomophilus]
MYALVFIDRDFEAIDYPDSTIMNRHYYCSQLLHLFYKNQTKIMSRINRLLEMVQNKTSIF